MIDATSFTPGLQLSERFFQDVVKPILDQALPGLVYSAALLGSGSEVLGFDTPQSMDHHWGPRVQLFMRADELAYKPAIVEVMSRQLPYVFRGIPTNFGSPDPIGVQLLQAIDDGPINHRVEVTTPKAFWRAVLAFDPDEEITLCDWLTFPEQHLLSITAGAVFHDGLGTLEPLRIKFRYYPHELWLHLLAAQWTRISQVEAFVGRCGDVGDEIGSRLIASSIIQDLMKLCFLMAKQYAPYAKWFGTAFARLEVAKELTPIFAAVQSAAAWKEREFHLAQAYAIVASRHNALQITPPLETTVSRYYGRPYLVIHADRFAEEIKRAITDEEVKQIAQRNIGAVDQFVDSTDVLSHPYLCRSLRSVYTA
jgi:hypothetical protein